MQIGFRITQLFGIKGDNMNIEKYLSENEIIKIGFGYSDIIVVNPLDFISKIKSMGYYICGILWWERIEIKKAALSIGYGGPPDPKNPLFFFAETDLAEKFTETCSVDSIYAYLKEVRDSYASHDLYPSFTIKAI